MERFGEIRNGMNHLSFRSTFALLALLFAGLFIASTLQAWTAPSASAPSGNVAAPINVGTTDQVKNAGLSVNALAVFGNEYVQNALGIGTVSPQVALDVNGTVKIGNAGEVCQSVTAGAIRYNSTSNIMEYCNGAQWCPMSGCAAPITVTPGSQAYTTPGSYTFIVPAYNTLTVTVAGAGGGGGGGEGRVTRYTYAGTAGTAGGLSTFNGSVFGYGGGGGGGGNGSSAAGSNGYGAGGTTNTTGGGASGGTGGNYSSGLTSGAGGPGGNGGESVQSYSKGDFTVGTNISILVGSGGGGGAPGMDSFGGATAGGNGSDGSVTITWQ